MFESGVSVCVRNVKETFLNKLGPRRGLDGDRPDLNEFSAGVEDRFECPQAPVVVLLPGQELLGQREHRHNLGSEVFRAGEPFRTQYHLP